MTKIWFGKEATITMGLASAISLSASKIFDTDVDVGFTSATAVTGQFKDWTIAGAMADVEIINLQGTTSGYQNAEMDEKPTGLIEFSGTLVLTGDEMIETLIFNDLSTAAGGTHTTYEPAKATRTKIGVLVTLSDGSDKVNFAATNMRVTQYEPSLAADGHAEVAFTAKCLPRDFMGPQFKD